MHATPEGTRSVVIVAIGAGVPDVDPGAGGGEPALAAPEVWGST
jgi:hypothetical protein